MSRDAGPSERSSACWPYEVALWEPAFSSAKLGQYAVSFRVVVGRDKRAKPLALYAAQREAVGAVQSGQVCNYALFKLPHLHRFAKDTNVRA